MKPFPPLLLIVFLTSIAHAQEKLDLRLRFGKGDVHQMTLTLDQTIDQTIQGSKRQTTQTIAIEYTFTVNDVDEQGTATVSVRYGAVAIHSKSPGGAEVNYDSSQPAGFMPPMVGGVAALVGQGYSMKITAAGAVTEVTGLDVLLKAVLAKLNIPEGPARIAAEQLLKQQLNEQNVKSSLGSMFAPFPDHPIAIGDSWYRKAPLNFGLALTLESTYTLKSRDNGMATIELTGRASTAPGAVLNMGQLNMSYDLQGELHGQLQIQESTGWPWISNATQTLTGNTTLRSAAMPTQIVPITVDSKFKTEQK